MYTLAKKVRDLEPYTPVEGRFRIHLDANESFLSPPGPYPGEDRPEGGGPAL